MDLRIAEGFWHVFEWYPFPESIASLNEVAKFLKKHLDD